MVFDRDDIKTSVVHAELKGIAFFLHEEDWGTDERLVVVNKPFLEVLCKIGI